MLGAAIGGRLFGKFGGPIGRARAVGGGIFFFLLFSCLGGFVYTAEQKLPLRFMVGLGVGGVWPNGVALVAECWPHATRPAVAGILGAGINVGILGLSLLGQFHAITAESWRWLFGLAAIPAVLGTLVIFSLPESPKWLAARGKSRTPAPPLSRLFRGSLLRPTIVGILLASIPLIGAWGGSKWMIPWAAHVGGDTHPHYKSTTQFCWAIGAILGGLLGSPWPARLGRRLSSFVISVGATAATWAMFCLTAPFEPTFLPIVFAQGFVATLFFGWLPLYLPELFPVQARASGAGVAMNIGRFVTAAGVLLGGKLFGWFGNDYSAVGAAFATVFAAGIVAAFLVPRTMASDL